MAVASNQVSEVAIPQPAPALALLDLFPAPNPHDIDWNAVVHAEVELNVNDGWQGIVAKSHKLASLVLQGKSVASSLGRLQYQGSILETQAVAMRSMTAIELKMYQAWLNGASPPGLPYPDNIPPTSPATTQHIFADVVNFHPDADMRLLALSHMYDLHPNDRLDQFDERNMLSKGQLTYFEAKYPQLQPLVLAHCRVLMQRTGEVLNQEVHIERIRAECHALRSQLAVLDWRIQEHVRENAQSLQLANANTELLRQRLQQLTRLLEGGPTTTQGTVQQKRKTPEVSADEEQQVEDRSIRRRHDGEQPQVSQGQHDDRQHMSDHSGSNSRDDDEDTLIRDDNNPRGLLGDYHSLSPTSSPEPQNHHERGKHPDGEQPSESTVKEAGIGQQVDKHATETNSSTTKEMSATQSTPSALVEADKEIQDFFYDSAPATGSNQDQHHNKKADQRSRSSPAEEHGADGSDENAPVLLSDENRPPTDRLAIRSGPTTPEQRPRNPAATRATNSSPPACHSTTAGSGARSSPPATDTQRFLSDLELSATASTLPFSKKDAPLAKDSAREEYMSLFPLPGFERSPSPMLTRSKARLDLRRTTGASDDEDAEPTAGTNEGFESQEQVEQQAPGVFTRRSGPMQFFKSRLLA
ncbi:hypothetical protein BDZ90DRAFT_280683 [Jaminaea rosea]|uniref:Uncharacterized protein n=1 Tax=Jaminaea rosea TaxID=1569628 RepID=A0A316UMG1_9BASI|nr:hypothetical protein BDZ90DRAFT_280683 [Jaminaea rosea]PWN26144.1 hypothetical protein BDZ90DRAFT_280683 [Jaminaea rosea]